MAAQTFLQMKTRVQAELNRPSTTYTSAIGDAIVSAIRFFEAKPVWFTEASSTLSLLINTNNIALPSNFKAMNTLKIPVGGYYRTQGTGFDQVQYKNLQREVIDSTKVDTPTKWADWTGKVYINCLADANYTLTIDYYKGDTTAPSADADTSIWFDEGQDLISVKAQAIFYRRRLHDFQTAQVYDAEANDIYNNLLSRSNMRDGDSMVDC